MLVFYNWRILKGVSRLELCLEVCFRHESDTAGFFEEKGATHARAFEERSIVDACAILQHLHKTITRRSKVMRTMRIDQNA